MTPWYARQLTDQWIRRILWLWAAVVFLLGLAAGWGLL